MCMFLVMNIMTKLMFLHLICRLKMTLAGRICGKKNKTITNMFCFYWTQVWDNTKRCNSIDLPNNTATSFAMVVQFTKIPEQPGAV